DFRGVQLLRAAAATIKAMAAPKAQGRRDGRPSFGTSASSERLAVARQSEAMGRRTDHQVVPTYDCCRSMPYVSRTLIPVLDDLMPLITSPCFPITVTGANFRASCFAL